MHPDSTRPLVALMAAVDARDWAALPALFTERVVLDYGVPELLTPAEIVARWRPFLAGFARTRHTLAELRAAAAPREDAARLEAAFTAEHELDGARWMLRGRYVAEALRDGDGWRLSRLRMIPTAAEGDLGLPDRVRAAAMLPAPADPGYVVEHVRIPSQGEELVGLLHLPTGATGTPPAVVVTGSWTTVKEQMAATYAQRLARAGFAALTFDFRGWGESSGVPRWYESPARKTEDIRSALAWLARRPGLAPRAGVLGICASAGYAAAAAADEPNAGAVALVAPWLHDPALAEAVYGGWGDYGTAPYVGRIAAGRAARERLAAGGASELVLMASASDAKAALYAPDPAYIDYYLNPARGAIPQWGNRFALLSWPDWLTYDAHASAPRLRVPTLMVHSQQGAIPDGARRYAAAMPTPARIVWGPGTQFHFYDDPATLDRTLAEVVPHLRRHLAG